MKLAEILKDKRLTCAIAYSEVGSMLARAKESDIDGRERAIAFCGDGNELEAPGALGEPYCVQIPDCPPSKEDIGSFHSHPPDSAHKSLGDWNNDIAFRRKVSCVAWPERITVIGNGKHKETRLTIECHTFHTEHQEYEIFRQRFLAVSKPAGQFNIELVKTLYDENRPSTPEEQSKYLEYKSKIEELVREGQTKGIISSCSPRAAFGEFSIPDVKRMLAEEKPPPPTREVPLSLVECDRRYSLSELRSRARAIGISTSGDKKALCRKLMDTGVV